MSDFATASGPNVQIYDSYTCEMISVMNGHRQDVSTIHWKAGDHSLCTVDIDGVSCIWNIVDGSMTSKNGKDITPISILESQYLTCPYKPGYVTISPTISLVIYVRGCVGAMVVVSIHAGYVAGAFTRDLSSGYVADDDCMIHQVDPTTMSSINVADCHSLSARHMLLVTSCDLMFLGMGSSKRGSQIRAMKLDSFPPKIFMDYRCHTGSVTCMAMSHDDKYLFSGGSDGSICIFKVKGPSCFMDNKTSLIEPEEALISKVALDEKTNEAEKLRRKVIFDKSSLKYRSE